MRRPGERRARPRARRAGAPTQGSARSASATRAPLLPGGLLARRAPRCRPPFRERQNSGDAALAPGAPARTRACSIPAVEPTPRSAARDRPRPPRRAGDPLSELVPFYDLDVEGYDADIELYRELAGQVTRPGARPASVLELGCGTGRIAAALARAGHPVTAIDASAAMIARCRERCAGLPVRSLRRDMRSLDLGERYRLVLVPLGGLEHMESAAGVVSALASVRRHLAPGGLAVVDVAAPQPEDLAPGAQPLLEQWTRELPAAGGAAASRVTKLVSLEARPSQGVRDVTWHFDVQPPGAALGRVTVRFSLRMITAGELELAAALAGLRVTDWYGDYDLAPLADGSARIVATLRRSRRRRLP